MIVKPTSSRQITVWKERTDQGSFGKVGEQKCLNIWCLHDVNGIFLLYASEQMNGEVKYAIGPGSSSNLEKKQHF